MFQVATEDASEAEVDAWRLESPLVVDSVVAPLSRLFKARGLVAPGGIMNVLHKVNRE